MILVITLQPIIPQAYASCFESGSLAAGMVCNMQILTQCRKGWEGKGERSKAKGSFGGREGADKR
jgi:hypothetical protein